MRDAGDGEHLEVPQIVGLLSSMSRGEFGMQRTDQCRVEIVSIGGVVALAVTIFTTTSSRSV